MSQQHIWEDDSGVAIDPFSLTPPFNGFWSATRGRNFIKDEFLSDWMKFHGARNGHTADRNNPNFIEEFDDLTWIFQVGNDFEEAVLNHIRTLPFVTTFTHADATIQSSVNQLEPVLDDETLVRDNSRRWCADRTFALMEAGVPIINSGVVINPENRTFGVPDLIVRNDVLAQLFDDVSAINPLPAGWTSDFPHSYYYRVVDVKWSTLAADVSNKEEYKLQLAIYDMALSRMQGLKDSTGNPMFSEEGYALAKKIIGSSSPQNPFNRPAVADLSTHYPIVPNCLNWLQTVSSSAASSWLPSRPELLGSNNSDRGDWSEAISDILMAEKDTTLLYEIGPGGKEKLLAVGIEKFDDSRIAANISPTLWTSSTGVKGINLSRQLQLLNMSPGETIPDTVANGGTRFSVNRANMLADSNIVDFYVDFETTAGWRREDWSNIRAIQAPGDFIYMIGCGYMTSSGWVDRIFTTNSLGGTEESRIIQEWFDWMDAVTTGGKRVYHWGHYESTAFGKANTRHGGIWTAPNWVDLQKGNHLSSGNGNRGLWVRDNNEGLYDFSIKTVAKVLNATGKISLSWPADINGLAADIGALNLENERIRTGSPSLRNLLFNNSGQCLFEMLEEYNRVDFRAIYEILNYVRNNHL